MLIGGPELKVHQALEIPTQLTKIISYARENVPAYKNFPNVDSFSRFGDFQQLPLVNVNQLAQAPEDFTSKRAGIFRISSSGGTTGIPKILYRTYEDHLFSSRVAAEMFKTSTISHNDIVAILQPFDVWGIAFIALEALRFLRATGLPVGSVLTDEQCLHWFKIFQPSVVYTTPSRASTIADLISETQPSDLNSTPRAFLLAGEPITSHIRSKLQKVFKSEVFSIYGSEETDGLAAECCSHAGMHLVEKGIIYELLDPETLSPTDSQTGMLVVTPLGWRGTVLIRYAIEDMIELDFTPCQCGKPTPRIIKIQRNTQGFYLWDALYVTDAQINNAIQKLFGKLCPYQCIIEGTKPPQVLLVLVDVPEGIMSVESMTAKLCSMIINSSGDLASACNAGEVRVVVKHTRHNRFRKTERGKIPKFLYKEQN